MSGVPPIYLTLWRFAVCQAEKSDRGLVGIISILAFSLMFRGINLERSRFRQIPTNFSTFVAR